ncbi:hypothetical protein [Chromatocurvus halotolerans]|uniref:Glutamate-ammonia-ligase adenylyltransferase n=1 Tax=Chromatocurvus halotolerans TaxID=1132028 RepID=A0A4R2KM38_9GAMM|nr:hypothetical protein [Chromatocurvus halotolerans]TCO74494.1 hypothetical protein EV688_11348 [Chromatocurvus halotolerans]
MDDFTKRYALVLAAVAVLGLAWWVFNRDNVAAEINATLERDAELADYPYTFRVVRIDEGVATVTSPRSARVPVMQFLRTAFPELADVPVDHPDMTAAQERLVAMQSRAADIISDHAEVRAVEWQIDEDWYSSRGVYIDTAR